MIRSCTCLFLALLSMVLLAKAQAVETGPLVVRKEATIHTKDFPGKTINEIKAILLSQAKRLAIKELYGLKLGTEERLRDRGPIDDRVIPMAIDLLALRGDPVFSSGPGPGELSVTIEAHMEEEDLALLIPNTIHIKRFCLQDGDVPIGELKGRAKDAALVEVVKALEPSSAGIAPEKAASLVREISLSNEGVDLESNAYCMTVRAVVVPIELRILLPDAQDESKEDIRTPPEPELDTFLDIHVVSDVDEPPRIKKRVRVVYPRSARRSRTEGVVILRFIVTKEGKVESASIDSSDPPGVFDDNSLQAIRQWQYEPATRGGEAIDVIVVGAFRFVLLEDDDRRLRKKRFYRQGKEWFDQGEHTRAIESFSKLLKLSPSNQMGRYARALAYARLGKHDEAVHDFTFATMLGDKNLDAYLGRGYTYMRMGKLNEAAADFGRAISGRPDDARAYIARSVILFKMGETSGGCLDLTRACELGECKRHDKAKANGVCRD